MLKRITMEGFQRACSRRTSHFEHYHWQSIRYGDKAAAFGKARKEGKERKDGGSAGRTLSSHSIVFMSCDRESTGRMALMLLIELVYPRGSGRGSGRGSRTGRCFQSGEKSRIDLSRGTHVVFHMAEGAVLCLCVYVCVCICIRNLASLKTQGRFLEGPAVDQGTSYSVQPQRPRVPTKDACQADVILLQLPFQLLSGQTRLKHLTCDVFGTALDRNTIYNFLLFIEVCHSAQHHPPKRSSSLVTVQKSNSQVEQSAFGPRTRTSPNLQLTTCTVHLATSN